MSSLKQNISSSSFENKDQSRSMCQKGRSGGASKNKGMYQK
jgi:hypothetical protein